MKQSGRECLHWEIGGIPKGTKTILLIFDNYENCCFAFFFFFKKASVTCCWLLAKGLAGTVHGNGSFLQGLCLGLKFRALLPSAGSVLPITASVLWKLHHQNHTTIRMSDSITTALCSFVYITPTWTQKGQINSRLNCKDVKDKFGLYLAIYYNCLFLHYVISVVLFLAWQHI